MTCEELLRAINDYVDGDIARDACAALEAHLGGCETCRVVVDTLEKTITIYRGEAVYELPAEVRGRLHAALRGRWRALHGPDAPSARGDV